MLLKANFLGRKFWGASFGGEILLVANFSGGNLGSKKFGEEFLGLKYHSGNKRIPGSKNVLERKYFLLGAKYFWEEKFGKQNLGSKTFLG